MRPFDNDGAEHHLAAEQRQHELEMAKIKSEEAIKMKELETRLASSQLGTVGEDEELEFDDDDEDTSGNWGQYDDGADHNDNTRRP